MKRSSSTQPGAADIPSLRDGGSVVKVLAARKALLGLVRTWFAASLLVLAGCDGTVASTCEGVGLCDPPQQPPEHVDVLCDRSLGSTCERTTLEETLQIVLRRVADRPGSSVRVWVLGRDVSRTLVVGEQRIPAPKRAGERARSAHAAKTAKAAQEHLVAAAARAFEESPTRASPIAEAITKAAAADAGGLPRRLVVLTDARQVSLVDFECRSLPTSAQFTLILQKTRALSQGSLSGMVVELVHVDGRPIPTRGCAVTLEREGKIADLWTDALQRAGAASVRVGSGPAVLPEFGGTTSSGREP